MLIVIFDGLLCTSCYLDQQNMIDKTVHRNPKIIAIDGLRPTYFILCSMLLYVKSELNLNLGIYNQIDENSQPLKWRGANRDLTFMFWIIANDCAFAMINLSNNASTQIELWGIKSTSGNFQSYQIQTAFTPFKIQMHQIRDVITLDSYVTPHFF